MAIWGPPYGFTALNQGRRKSRERHLRDFVPLLAQIYGRFCSGTFVSSLDCCGNGAHAPRSKPPIESNRRGHVMLGWIVTFLIVALIAGILGFGGVAGASIEIAKIIFFIAVVLFLVSAVVGVARGRSRV